MNTYITKMMNFVVAVTLYIINFYVNNVSCNITTIIFITFVICYSFSEDIACSNETLDVYNKPLNILILRVFPGLWYLFFTHVKVFSLVTFSLDSGLIFKLLTATLPDRLFHK